MPTISVDPSCESQLQEIANILGKSRKVVVVTGAGISTNCGIPDFRSENGLYALIQAQYDARLAKEQESVDFEDRPAKRRKLDRSCSLGSVPATVGAGPPERRQLRSSQSFIENQPSATNATTPNVNLGQDRRLRSSRYATDKISLEACENLVTENDAPQPQPPPSLMSSQNPTVFDDRSNSPDIPSSQNSTASSTRTSLPNLKGKDLFDSMIWSDAFTTSIFYTFISSLRQKIRQEVTTTTETHKFIRVLRDGGRLVRNYTQNIDMLEEREGLCTELEKGAGNRGRFSHKSQKDPRPAGIAEGTDHDAGVEVVHLHGNLERLRCGLCSRLSSWDEEDRHGATLAGEAPECPWCLESSASREGKGRRSLAIGRLRPDIVLYGEEHPSAHLVAPLITHDLSLNPDVLLILGTSLRVHGLKVMVKEFAKAVHGRGGKVIFVNQTKSPESIWGDVIDYWVEWDCDAWVEDLKLRKKEIWLPQGTPVESASKGEKTRPPAKNPAATRPDITNGAYLTTKIMTMLGQLSGRISDRKEAASNQEPVKSFVEQAKTRKRKPRPNAIRESKDNAACVVFEIMRNLRQITECCNGPQSLIGKSPLSNVSVNVPSRQALAKDVKTADLVHETHQLPTPPTSDQSSPEPPMTPETRRIKQRSSISAILSSPLSGGRRLRVWRAR